MTTFFGLVRRLPAPFRTMVLAAPLLLMQARTSAQQYRCELHNATSLLFSNAGEGSAAQTLTLGPGNYTLIVSGDCNANLFNPAGAALELLSHTTLSLDQPAQVRNGNPGRLSAGVLMMFAGGGTYTYYSDYRDFDRLNSDETVSGAGALTAWSGFDCAYNTTEHVVTQQSSAGMTHWEFDGSALVQNRGLQFANVYLDAEYTVSVSFDVSSSTRATIQSSNAFPVMPSGASSGGGYAFSRAPSGRRVDPPLAYGYRFQSTGTANFSRIFEFPDGVDADGTFEVATGGLALGSFHVSDVLDFVALTGAAVPSFEITGIEPLVDASDATAFIIGLEYDQPTADFDMDPLYISASATSRNAGTNPNSLTCTTPVLGEIWHATLDLSSTGHSFAFLNFYRHPGQIALRGGQLLLGKDRNLLAPGGHVPLGLFKLGPAIGPIASFTLDLPLDQALVGNEMTVQGIQFGGGAPFALSNAQDLVLGF